MGLSGSGKSTLLRAANGLNAVTRGQVLVADGEATVDIGQLRSHAPCGASAASASPWCSSSSGCCPGARCATTSALVSNCAVTRPRSAARSSTRQLELVGLSQWAERYASELSGGMQQRVGLARAFATDADILLMDEPFSALDPLIRRKLQDELLALQERVSKTILFVSHDLDEALQARRPDLDHGRRAHRADRHRARHRASAPPTTTWPSSCAT